MPDLRIDDFSGGITDNYVNGPLNRAQVMDNFLINRNKKPYQRNGSELFDADLDQIPAGNQRINRLKYFQDNLFEFSARNIYYRSGGIWNVLQGAVDNNPAYGAGSASSLTSVQEWQKHLITTINAFSRPRKVFHDGSDWQVRTAGLPEITSPAITAGGAGANNYIYYLCFLYTYTVGNVTYLDYGPTYVERQTNVDAPTATSRTITWTPLTNGTTECWDTDSIEVLIYRTENNDTVGKYVGKAANTAGTFTDNYADSTLGNPPGDINPYIYTTGGVVDNDPPPLAKYVVVVDDIAWYLNVQENGENKGFRARQSVQYDFDSCPASFFQDVDDDITGGGYVDIYPIVFTKNRTYRFESHFDELGRGFIRKRLVSDQVGCVSHNSIVPVLRGCFFASADGFYFTDGFGVKKLSEHLDETYAAAVQSDAQAARIYGAIDKERNRIYWTVQSDPSDTECDKIFVLDPYWGLTEESTFTTLSGGANMQPTCLEFVGGDMVRGDGRGYTFRHVSTAFTDPVVDTGLDTSFWITTAVIYNYTSCAFNFGSETVRKYVTKLLSIFKNITNVSVQPYSLNDDSDRESALKEIRFRNNVTWGDPEILWGDPEIIWNYTGLIVASRRFPKGGMRCTHKQIKFTNSDTVISNSDSYGEGTVDTASLTVSLNNHPTFIWTEDAEGYFISFDYNGYAYEHEVTNRTDDTLTITDPDGTLVDGSHEWVLRGKRRDERIEIQAYTITYEFFGKSITQYRTGDDGANAE